MYRGCKRWIYEAISVGRGQDYTTGRCGVRCGTEGFAAEAEDKGGSWETWPSRAQEARMLDGSAL